MTKYKKLSIIALILCIFSAQTLPGLHLPSFNLLNLVHYCTKKTQPIANFVRQHRALSTIGIATAATGVLLAIPKIRNKIKSGMATACLSLGVKAINFPLSSKLGRKFISPILLYLGAHLGTPAQLNTQHGPGRLTPLHTAANDGHLRTVQTLIKKGADCEALDGRNFTPLHWATEKTAQILINAHANLEHRQGSRMSPLFFAAMCGRTGTVRTLIKAGANIETQCNLHVTPLSFMAGMRVLEQCEMETIRLLVQAGANINSQGHLGGTIRSDIRNQEIRDYFDSIEDQKAHLQDAIARHDLQATQALVEEGAPIIGQDGGDYTPIHNAIGDYNRNEPTVLDNIARTLIGTIGARTNAARNSLGQTPLHIAVQRGNLWIAEYLLRNGANVNVQDNGGNTPLHYAATAKMRNKLLRHHADCSISNRDGATPLSSNVNLWGSIFNSQAPN